jgi:biopolymer transport protein ExbD
MPLLAAACALGCKGDEAARTALAQRVDQLERRLDAVETAQAKAAAAPPPAPKLEVPEITPPDVAATKTRNEPVLRVGLGKAGVTIDGAPVADDALDATLRSHATRSDLSGVILTAEDDVDYASVTRLMDRLRDSGLDRVAIAKRGGAEPPE